MITRPSAAAVGASPGTGRPPVPRAVAGKYPTFRLRREDDAIDIELADGRIEAPPQLEPASRFASVVGLARVERGDRTVPALDAEAA